ncbi:MAG: C1 family peptidase, partial [Ruminococcus sp.]|nr:C1 family peptidase [Ruminococcus sp.]
MKTIKRLIASICACTFSLTGMISALTVSATSSDIEPVYVATDGIWQSAAESDAELINAPMARSELPTSVDNSATAYFPTIGNQGSIGSCAGWATTYYQYTYEVNKFRNIETNDDNVYSPSWTYNYINGGANRGTYLNDAYDILTNHGAMKLCDYSYNTSSASYSYAWSTNVQKMTEALKYRVNRYYVNCLSSYDLYNAKYNLSSGKVGVVWTDSNGWTMGTTNTNENIIVRGSNSDGGHFMAVVGYDDTITTTYNGITMTGAFKLANSWGTNWDDGNDGYIWVAYDALNSSSIYGKSWQSNLSNTRQQIFGYNNEMNFVNIEHYNTYYVGKVTYISNDPWHNKIFGDISTTAYTSKFTPYTGVGSASNLQNPEYRVIVFDYFNNPNLDVANYINSSFT